jgi:apolipoprotein N-acyltransferase
LTRVVNRSMVSALFLLLCFWLRGGWFSKCRLGGRMVEMMRMVWAVDGFEGGLVGYSLLMCEML